MGKKNLETKEASPNNQEDKPRKIIAKLLYSVITLLILVILVGGFLGYKQYNKLSDENKKLSNPEESAKVELQNLKNKISKLVDVPTDEEPTVASVTDISKLQGQAFFARAQNGDKVFMYNKAKKAILYRPSSDKVIEFAPITIDQKTPDKQDGVKTSSDSASTDAQAPATTPTQP